MVTRSTGRPTGYEKSPLQRLVRLITRAALISILWREFLGRSAERSYVVGGISSSLRTYSVDGLLPDKPLAFNGATRGRAGDFLARTYPIATGHLASSTLRGQDERRPNTRYAIGPTG
jgi:hypothetical protein